MKLLEEALQDLPESFIQLLENYHNEEKTFHTIQSHLEDLLSNDEKVNFLQNVLILAKGFYYEEGRWIQEKYNIHSLINDKDYDSIEKIFKSLNSGEIEVGLKTNIINGVFPKHIHTRIPGVSQHKTTKQIDVDNLLVNKGIDKQPLVLSEKLDGSSLYLIYNNQGKLFKGVTRGDGVEGNDITVNISNIKGIQKQLDLSLYPENIKEIEIRGETIMTKEQLKLLNEELENLGEKTYKNTRNVIPGILMSPYNNRGQYLSFKAYQEIYEDVNGNVFERDYIDKFKTLEKHGFSTPFYKLLNQKDEIFKIYDEYVLGKRRSLEYDIDGLVIVVNDVNKKNELGFTNKKENGSFAFKFPADAVLSKVVKIHFQLGDSSGNLTPVVEIEPAEIEGVTVTKISLANEALFNSTALSVGDHVYIRRSGDVIPQIVKNAKFDYYYNFYEEVINNLFEQYKNLENKELQIIMNSLYNKYIDSYSETIPLRFETMTYINKFLLKYKNEDVSNEQILKDLKEDFLEIVKKDGMREIKKIKFIEEQEILDKELHDELLKPLFSTLTAMETEVFDKNNELNKIYSNNIEFIKNCPVCGSSLDSNGIISKCVNKDCDGRKMGEIINFIEKTEIKGVGGSSIEFLFENKLIYSIEDLFTLEKKDFVISVDPKGNEVYFKGWGERKIDNTLSFINELKNLEANVFLGSLGIQQYGRSSFEKLLNHYPFEDIINNKLTVEEYQNVEGFQNVDNLIESLKEKKSLINNLLKHIVIKEVKKEELQEGTIKIYFTGSPKGIKINEEEISNKDQLFKALSIVSNGMIVQTEKFSKSNCDVLLYGGDATTKIDKAKKMGIKTVDINDLIKYVDVNDKTKLLNYLNINEQVKIKDKKNSDVEI